MSMSMKHELQLRVELPAPQLPAPGQTACVAVSPSIHPSIQTDRLSASPALLTAFIPRATQPSPSPARLSPAHPRPEKPSGSSRDVGLTSFYYSLVSVHLFRDAAPRSHPFPFDPGRLAVYYTTETPYEYSMTLAPGLVTTGANVNVNVKTTPSPKQARCILPQRR